MHPCLEHLCMQDARRGGMRGHCHLASITGIGHFRLPGRMDGIPTLPVLHGLREPNAPSQILGGVSDPARVCTAHKCDSLGRTVTRRGQMTLFTSIALPPAPAPLRRGVRLLPPAYLAIEDPRAEVAVGHERPPSACVGRGQALVVMDLSPLDLRLLASHRHGAEKPQGVVCPTWIAMTITLGRSQS